jgi:hypothetical protein
MLLCRSKLAEYFRLVISGFHVACGSYLLQSIVVTKTLEFPSFVTVPKGYETP